MYYIPKYIVFVSLLLSTLFFPATVSHAGHEALIRWNVGKIIVLYDDKYFFQSTGFLFRNDGKHFLITTNHTIENIERTFGNGYTILVQFPNMDMPLACTLRFTEPQEDSAVLQVDYPGGKEIPQPDYEQSLDMPKGYRLAIIGYSDTTYKRHDPIILLVEFLTPATLNFKSEQLRLPPHLKHSDSKVFLTKGGSPHPGMSGGPVVKEDTLSLLGMTKSYGNSRQDREITDKLGTDEFHIVVRLDKTIKKIKNLK